VLNLHRRDRGTTALMVAASLFLLCGFAAIAIDVGDGFNERRLDQNGADSAVMGGAVSGYLDGNLQTLVTEVTDLVDANVRPVSDADWVALCADTLATGRLAVTAADLGLTPATNCISFTGGYREIRVRIPTQSRDTTFGTVIGFNSVAVSAAAQAHVGQPGQASPPFVVPFGIGAGTEICLRTNSSSLPLPAKTIGNGPGTPSGPGTLPNDADPCDDTVYDPFSSFFGMLNPHSYENPVTGGVLCTSGEVSYSIAAGIDHNLTEFEPDFGLPGADPVVEDDCPGSNPGNPNPNTMQLNTGLTAGQLRCGMITDGGGVCGSGVPAPAGPDVDARLQRGPTVQGTYEFLEEEMDNTALWDYLVTTPLSGSFVPPACSSLQSAVASSPASWDYYDYKDSMVDCLKLWAPDNGPLFTPGVIDNPRFAWLPYLAEMNLDTAPTACPSTSAPKCVHFNSFVPAWLQGMYSKFTGGQNRFDCDTGGNSPRWGIHQSGEDGSCGRQNDQLDRLSGIVLHCQMLPEAICLKVPGNPVDPSGKPLPAVQLTR